MENETELMARSEKEKVLVRVHGIDAAELATEQLFWAQLITLLTMELEETHFEAPKALSPSLVAAEYSSREEERPNSVTLIAPEMALLVGLSRLSRGLEKLKEAKMVEEDLRRVIEEAREFPKPFATLDRTLLAETHKVPTSTVSPILPNGLKSALPIELPITDTVTAPEVAEFRDSVLAEAVLRISDRIFGLVGCERKLVLERLLLTETK